MRLLFDQNLSPRLVDRLIDEFPGSIHVSTVGLDVALDRDLWEFARDHGCVIVTKDADFADMSVLLDFPPKVIWLRLGNCATRQVETVIRANRSLIEAWENDSDSGILLLS